MASAQVAEQEAAVAAAAVPDWVFDPNEPRYCLCNQVSLAQFVFSRDVTSAMLVSLNKGTAAVLVFAINPPGIELYSSGNVFFFFCFG